MKNRLFASSKLAAGTASLALLSLLAGCGIGSIAISPASEGLSLSGHVHGGEQGVVGAAITLYTVGATGYGSNANALLTSTVTTDQNGYWSISGKYTCPAGSPQAYIVATGGNPGLAAGTNNTAIKLVAALGPCNTTNLTANTNIDINEVTTVAAAFAMGQYFGTTFAIGQNAANTSGDSFGAPATTQGALGLTNAVATTFRLADFTTGNAVTSQTLTSTPGTITTTVESAKIYTLANIISSCVNTTGPTSTPCAMLFGSVAPMGSTVPVDTLQALVYMSLNPTSTTMGFGANDNSQANLATLYALQTPTAPFVGVTSQPNDWTLGINYAAPNNTTETLIAPANGIAIDASGNVWIINYNSSATSTESMSGFSPTGVPIANVFNSGAAAPASMAATTPRNIAVDLNGNILATTSSSSSYVFSYNYGTSTSSTYAVSGQGYAIAIDGSNDVFVGHNSSSSNLFSLDEFVGGTLAATAQDRFPTASSTNAAQNYQYAAFTTAGNLYVSAGGNNASQIVQVSAFNTTTCTAFPCTTATATFTPITGGGTILNPYNMAGEKNGGLWIANNVINASNQSTVVYLSGLPATPTASSYGSSAAFTTPQSVAVDGGNNAWFANKGTQSVSEINTAGSILSPFTTNNGTTTVGSIGFVHSGMSTQNGIAVDPSGNVWVSNGSKAAAANAPNSIFELVGAATPTIAPIAAQFKTGVTPGTRP